MISIKWITVNLKHSICNIDNNAQKEKLDLFDF